MDRRRIFHVEEEYMTKNDKISERKLKFVKYGSKQYFGLFGPKKNQICS